MIQQVANENHRRLKLLAPSRNGKTELVWNEDHPLHESYEELADRLLPSGDLFRNPFYGSGLILALPDGESRVVTKGADFWPIIVDHGISVRVVRNGKNKGREIPTRTLDHMLKTELFLRNFDAVDQVTKVPLYLPDFTLTTNGYNPGGEGFRILYRGDAPLVSGSMEHIKLFLKQMDFATDADRANAVAALLTVQLRNHWPGGKPIILATGTVSHSGKDTVLDFAAGLTPSVSISYQSTDWALQREFVGAVKLVPDVGMIVAENARLSRRESLIASAYLERTATTAEPFLFSTGTGAAIRIRNGIVLAISTNYGTVSEDILNRSLPIHLAPKGDIHTRESKIGNPRLEFLPTHKEDIAAEARGMIAKWVAEGMPHDTDVRHPFSEWAKVIGGILKVNNVHGFLANYGKTRITTDPIREALGQLGASMPGAWYRLDKWVEQIGELGLTKTLIRETFRETPMSMVAWLGKLFNAQNGQTVEGIGKVEGDAEDKRLTLRLEYKRFRRDGNEAKWECQFKVIATEDLPEDAPPDDLPAPPVPPSNFHIDTSEDDYVERDD